jgi:multiple sugar transport system permease protein
MSKRRAKINIGRAALYGVLIVSSLAMAYPLILMLVGSVATIDEYSQRPWFPITLTPDFANYAILLDPGSSDLFLWIRNTLFRAGWYIAIPAVLSVTYGYVLAKMRFKGRDLVFTFLLSSMVLPGIVYLIPTYVMFARWPLAGGNDILGQGGTGFLNQWPAMLISGLINVYYIFMFRQTFISIPFDFEEAARVDGANTFQVLTQVYLPMLTPTLVVLIIGQFVLVWNEYVWPLFVVSGNRTLYPLALGFQYLYRNGLMLKGRGVGPGFAYMDYPFAFALGVMTILPLVLLYFVLQRHFVEGVAGFAIKG